MERRRDSERGAGADPAPERPALDFGEPDPGYRISQAVLEADRCLQCVEAPCASGCPVDVDVPRFLRGLRIGDLPAARATIAETNLFPGICGRVCDHERQCEAHCVLGADARPIQIGRLERFVGDHGPEPDRTRPAGPRAGRVAIVGSGPAGLACATASRSFACPARPSRASWRRSRPRVSGS